MCSYIERFHHVITFHILEINRHLGVQLVQYVISSICDIDLKNPQVSVYISVLT